MPILEVGNLSLGLPYSKELSHSDVLEEFQFAKFLDFVPVSLVGAEGIERLLLKLLDLAKSELLFYGYLVFISSVIGG